MIRGIDVSWITSTIDAKIILEYPTYLVMERQTDSGPYRFCIQKSDFMREGDNLKSGRWDK